MLDPQTRQYVYPILKGAVVVVIGCILFVVLMNELFADLDLGALFLEHFGTSGLFFGVLISELAPTPGGSIPLMALCLKSGAAKWLVLLSYTVAAGLACLVGYGLGYRWGVPQKLQKGLEKKHPGLFDWMAKKGLWGVVLLALLPVPISFCSWTAGALKVPLGKAVLLAMMIRIPKISLYLWTILAGISVFG